MQLAVIDKITKLAVETLAIFVIYFEFLISCRISDEKEAVTIPVPALVLIRETRQRTLGLTNQIFSSAAARSYCRN